MSPATQRLFLFTDEWLWVLLCLYLLNRWVRFGPSTWSGLVYGRILLLVAIAGALMIYGVGYPGYWGWWKP